MERLIIRNFLTINHIDIQVNDFTVLIGEQASGKSVIAKSLYFFYKFINSIFIPSIFLGNTKKIISKQATELFESYFPKYAWGKSSFKIEYFIHDISISIERTKTTSGDTRLIFNYSDNLGTLQRKLKRTFKSLRERSASSHSADARSEVNGDDLRDILDSFRNKYMSDFYKTYVRDPVFIPASRSFFANLQKGVFSFLANNIDIDPFVKEFGSAYENSKYIYNIIFSRQPYFGNDDSSSLTKNMLELTNAILKGEYVYYDNQDWIDMNNGRINVAQASSGQQEALPMLLTLTTLPIINKEYPSSYQFFIEEPEAHLYPFSQMLIINLLSMLLSKRHRVVVTTHSPYVLSSINNLLLAYDIISNNSSIANDIYKLLHGGVPIDYGNVSAFMLSDGNAVSITEDETRLIRADKIDSVAELIGETFDTLLEFNK